MWSIVLHSHVLTLPNAELDRSQIDKTANRPFSSDLLAVAVEVTTVIEPVCVVRI